MFRRILFFCLAAACPASLRAADWPEFLGQTRNAVSAETGLIDALPPAGLPVRWSAAVGAGYSAPSVRGELLVLHHRVGGEERVEAFDAKTGARRWSHGNPSDFTDPFGYNNGPRGTPLLTADRCFTLGAEGLLLCLDLQTGEPVWQRDTGRDFHVPEAFFGVGTSPILEGDRLIVMAGGQPNAGVVAFDAATGKTLWANVGEKTWNGVPMTGWPGERTVRWNPADPAFDKQASYCTPVAATICGERQILCITRQGLVSLDPATGAANFSFWFRARQDSSVNAMTPVVQGDTIFLSSAYFKTGSVLLQVEKLEASSVERGADEATPPLNAPRWTLHELWRSLALEMHWSQPVLHAGHLFAFSGRNEPDARFRCVELATGALKWDRAEGFPNGGHAKLAAGETPPNVFGRGSSILADGKLIALGECGLLGLFRPHPEKLEELGRWQVPGLTYPCWAGPVLAGGRLYLRGEDRLVCLDLAATPEKPPATAGKP